MISRKQWVVLLLFYLFYLLLGSIVFILCEAGPEEAGIRETYQKLRGIQLKSAELIQHEPNDSSTQAWVELLNQIEEFSGNTIIVQNDIKNFEAKGNTNYQIEGIPTREEIHFAKSGNNQTEDENATVEKERLWTLWNSFFFTFTCITTIGYGNMSPVTEMGQIFSILYSLIGVPLNCILFSGLADLFTSKLIKKQEKPGRYDSKCLLLLDVVWYLVPGLVVLMMVPAGVFCYMEGWTYTQAFYFAFISLTTIGFGDLVAGRADTHYGASLDGLYKGGVFIWIVFGLGYLLMVVGIIQRGLKSEDVRKVDRKVAKIFKKKATNLNMRSDLQRLRNILEAINKLKDRQSLFNTSYTVSTQQDLQKVNESQSSHLKTTASNTEISQNQQAHIDSNGMNNVNIFMDMAETILQQQEHHKHSQDHATEKSGPTSSHSDPSPSGTFFNDSMNIQLVSSNDHDKNKSDSFLSSPQRKDSIPMNKYLELCKGVSNSYTNQAYEAEEQHEGKINKDIESSNNPENPNSSEKFIKFKNYIKEKFQITREKSIDDDTGSNASFEGIFTLSHLLGEIETLLLTQIHQYEIDIPDAQFKRTLSVPINDRLPCTIHKSLHKGNRCSTSNENPPPRARRWTLASINPDRPSRHPTILHSISEPAPTTLEKD